MNAWDLDEALRPSRLHALLLAVVYVMALTAVWLPPLPVAAAVLASVAWLGSAWLAWQRWRRPVGESVSGLSWAGEQMAVTLANGQRLRVIPEAAAVWRWLVVIRVRAVDVDWSEHLLVLPDSLPSGQFRRLKVRLLSR